MTSRHLQIAASSVADCPVQSLFLYPDPMKHQTILKAFAASLFLIILAVQAPAQSPERGYWRAASNTAHSITGDITLADEKLVINFYTTTISHVRALDPTEVSSVFDTDADAHATGSLYKLSIPATKKFLHKNSLCGGDDVTWMAAYAAAGTLHLAFFSSDKPPVFTFDAIANSAYLCGTFTYTR